ncbi:MAG: ABC transporter permease [Myxococcales bacterium]|nr:ABC transporter permease [Myxococcales bacterium]
MSGRFAAVLGGLLLLLLLLPLLSLGLSAPPGELLAGARHPSFAPAAWLSLRTTLISLGCIVVCGTPIAWWLSRNTGRRARVVELCVDLPIVIPPAVMGVALLQTFGRRGLFGPALESLGIALPFTSAAVVIAQVVVASPFYIQAAANAFRRVDPELLTVARTLGASPAEALLRVGMPAALPGLLTGASLAWARALGEFGATLLFAGNAVGTTQTLPLAIYAALESDVRAALAISLVLAGIGALLLLTLRGLPRLLRWPGLERRALGGAG